MDKERKKQLMVKIGCVLASFCLWLYVSYSENPLIEKEIKKIPVELLNEDKLSAYNKVLYDDQEFYVTITVEATESVMRQIKPSSFKVAVDLDSVYPKTGVNTYLFKIIETPENVRISPKNQMGINIKLDELISKGFDVNVKVSGTPKEGFYANTPEISLDRVTIEGPERYVKTIKEVVAEVNVDETDSDIIAKSQLKAVDMSGERIKKVAINPGEVTITVPIGRTKEVPIRVEKIGTLDGKLKIKQIKPEIGLIKVKGEKEDVNNIAYIKTEPINLSSITGNTVVELKLEIPNNVTLENNIKTVKVNIIVEKCVERKITSEIKIKNISDNHVAELTNKNVVVTLKGPEEKIKELDYKYLEVYVDLTSLGEGEHVVPIETKFTGDTSIEILNIDINPITVKIKSKENVPTDGEVKEETNKKANKKTDGVGESNSSGV